MLTKTLSEAKKKQRNILIKAMNNDIGSIDSAKDSWNPAQISERAKDISYIRSLVDTWNPAQLNEALRMLDLPVIDTWNPAQIEEQRRNLVFYLAERTLTGNPITLNILGNLSPKVTGLKVTMNPIQDLHGYSNPWAGGAGKNKCPQNSATSTSSGGLNLLSVGTFGSVQSGKTYTFSFTPLEVNELGLQLRLNNVSGSLKGWSANTLVVNQRETYTFTASEDGELNFYSQNNCFTESTKVFDNIQLEEGSTATAWTPYENICPITGRTEVNVTRTAGEDVEIHTHQYSETVYGGVDDFVNGGLSNEWGYIASYDGETLPGEWMSDRDVYAPDTTPTTGAEVVYRLETPTTIETSAEEITLLKGTNVLSTDGDSIELKYKQNF